jgi:Right handed beta helix region/Immunoglobulin I-set domain
MDIREIDRTARYSTIVLAFAIAGCGGGNSGGGTSTQPSNPAPSISSISPASTTVGGAGFTLTVNGSSFINGSTVQWNGSALSTTYVSATQITAAVPASDIATTGTISVTVNNPSPGGGTSSATSFTIGNPVPAITSLSPATITAGGAAFTLTVNGSNFVSGSTVQWNGSSRTTTYVSATQLTAAITAADIATAGTASVTVINPSPGGGTSQAQTFTTNNPAPALTSVSPSSATAGGASFTLTVNGNNFISGSTIQWNATALATSYVSATQLTAAVPAADIATVGIAQITVVNSAPGGGTTSAVSIAINNPVPSIASLYPSSAQAAGSAFTLTVNGSGFLPGSTIQWNGSYGQPPLSTTYVSATQLTVSIPASDIAFAGTANVAVINPAPGGGVSAGANFVINGTIPGNVSFVAPNGSDSNPGTIAQPYLTIQKCATTISSGSICAIRAGTYRETVVPNSGITITSYDGEPVTVDGSNPVTGWSLYQGSIYQTSVTLASDDSNQIFVGNQMMTEARWPVGNDLFHVNWSTAQTGTTTTQVLDSNLPNIDWTGAKIHLWSGTDPWDPQTGTITASQSGQITFTVDGASFPPYIQPQAGGYYYLYRSLGALTAQDQWYYDPSATTLYLWAPGGVNPSTLNVFAKQRQYAFDLSGTSNVTIEYVYIFASSINMDASSTNNTLNGINAQYISQFTDLLDVSGQPHSYWYDYTATSGIIINGTGNILENSTIAYSAGNGVALSGSNNTIQNNLIQYTDYAADYCSGITLTFQVSTGNEIENNTVQSDARFGIDYLAGTDEDISYNNFFSAMMISRDGGEIYLGGLSAAGTNIHNNWFHDTQALVSGSADNYALPGVYLDEDSSNITVEQNVFWNNEFYNIFVNGSNDGITSPNNNDIQNNTIPDVNSTGTIYTDLNATCGTTQIVNNLVLVPVTQDGTVCTATNNSSTAPGATQMTSSVQVGCNFAGCSSEGPPTISGTSVSASIAVQPYGMTVTTGQSATFTVIAAGSPTITYQWQRNGSNIAGATSASYTTAAATSSDNGAVFTVTVANSIGSVTSNPATLTVQ